MALALSVSLGNATVYLRSNSIGSYLSRIQWDTEGIPNRTRVRIHQLFSFLIHVYFSLSAIGWPVVSNQVTATLGTRNKSGLLTPTSTKVKVIVAQSCPTLCDPMDYIVHGILQARILGRIMGSHFLLQGIFPTQVSHIAGWFFTSWATEEALILTHKTNLQERVYLGNNNNWQCFFISLIMCEGPNIYWHYHLVTLWSWSRHFAYLSLNFLICKRTLWQ